MKTILLAFAATAISAISAINVNAQNAMNVSTSDLSASAFDTPASATNNSSASINLKAVKDFKKSFAAVSNESWEKISDGYVAIFEKDGIETTVGYNKKGNRVYDILRYDESKLPRDVRAQVKSTYYDYSITQIEEVHILDQTIYLVHMQDNNSWKIVRVSDEGMDVYQAFDKAK